MELLEDCKDFLEIYSKLQLNSVLVKQLVAESNVLLERISECIDLIDNHDDLDDLDREAHRWKRIIKNFVVSMLGKYEDPAAAAAKVPIPQPAPVQRDRRDASPNTLDLIRRDVMFFMGQLNDDMMTDVAQGAEVSNSELRDLKVIILPQINKSIDDLRKVLKIYASYHNYDRDLARDAQDKCEFASVWASDLMSRYHQQKLHLEKNTVHREITFSSFKPGGNVSVYQFLNKFEAWADGYLSEEAKADLLFNKYLDTSITESYTEITLIQDDFEEMKRWLIKKYGSVVPIARGCIKAIAKLTMPAESNHSASVIYLRGVHKLLVNLSELELTKGRPVPDLQEYLSSNAFLSALIETIPQYIKAKLFKELLKIGIDDIDTIKGQQYLPTIIHLIKQKFMTLELMIKSSPNLPPQSSAQQPIKKANKPVATTHHTAAASLPLAQLVPPTNYPVTPSTPPSFNPPSHKSADGGSAARAATTMVTGGFQSNNNGVAKHSPKLLTGGNATPLGQGTQNSRPRWPCLIGHHRDHELYECQEFWNLSIRDRRYLCRYGGCYTCLRVGRDCREGCVFVHEVPAELICVDCAKRATQGKAPPLSLFCGLQGHTKPPIEDLIMSLEAWIPNLNLGALTTPFRIHFSMFDVYSASLLTPPACHKTITGPPTLNPGNVVYDTTTGRSRTVSQKDTINRTSSDTAFYAMQTLRIKNEEVLVFYDSGSNGHLIEGQTAELLDLDILSCETVPIGGLGGKVTWTNYGKYTIILGPDAFGECHELDMQGIKTITNPLPEVNLTQLWDEANTVLHKKRQLPPKVGGSPVQILIGIKSTRLSPKLIHSLPSGLGIYESVFYDVNQSNICFGGPHPIFTTAYRAAGFTVNHMDVMFTELAQAYLESPRTYVRTDVDEHGPPLEFARELDLVEELNSYINSPKQLQLLTYSPDLPLLDSPIIDIIPSPELVPVPYLVNHFDHDESGNESSSDPILPPPPQFSDDPTPPYVFPDNRVDHCEHLNCMKSTIPLSKLKGLQDELDIPEVVEFKCSDCVNCPTCKLSARAKTKSLQESFEQEVIEKSVHVDLGGQRVWVDLPFIKEPVEFLTKKHGASDNKRQALRVYNAQCAKQENIKEQVRKAHGELVEKGYMQELNTLPKETQDLIADAPFRHYYPWRAVHKDDSVTTPVRLVVDPTMTGLNEILAKGTNMLSRIPELLIRFRCFTHTWNTDISKLYNQLHLNDSALPFSLFLFHESLEKDVDPDVWVMSRAWYGVSSTGNQAGVALEYLADEQKDDFPLAHDVLTRSRYVDDVLSGADSHEEVAEQIHQTTECLKAGGFTMKYIAKSGEPPPSKATSDGVHVGCLGLSWNTESDTLALGFNEDFFLKRFKGHKLPPDMNLADPDCLSEAMARNLLTRAGVLSRVAELYDPCGWWEPLKVQMKLSLQHFNGLEWTAPVPEDQRKTWLKLFGIMNQIRTLTIPRCVLPVSVEPGYRIRLLTVTDAAADSCGCAIYAGVELPDSSYSSNLVYSKSKMVHGTIPRNELEGAVLGAEASLTVQQAVGSVESAHYFTDSRIVVCWALNTAKRLRMWAFNRVQALHNMIRRVVNKQEVLPLYHISGTDNPADILTKPRVITDNDLLSDSVWHKGPDWMRLPTLDLPSVQFVTIPPDLEEPYNQEIFQEVVVSTVSVGQEERDVLVAMTGQDLGSLPSENPSLTVATSQLHPDTWFTFTFKFKELGWGRARKRLKLVLKACTIFHHRLHKQQQASWRNCYLCRDHISFLELATDQAIDTNASHLTELYIPRKKLAERFRLSGEIWLSHSRLEKEGLVECTDLDCVPFFDRQSIKKLLPIVHTNLDLFHSYLAYVHNKLLPHMGVENTLRVIRERFYPIGNARAIIFQYKARCTHCRIALKRVVDLEMAQFPHVRTTVAPPFWAIQLDIAMSFSAKPTITSRKTFPCHALVIVCLLTSATNILVLDGLTTQAVVQALERHSSRYGVPAQLFVDSGTQLEKLQDASFQLRDVCTRTSTAQFKVTVTTPKAHQQQGRVEAKVKIMRKMLVAWSSSCNECNTLLGWETLFARVASAIDDLPIARGSASAAMDLGWEIITPNRLKLGRNNNRQLEGPIKLDNCPQTQLERNRLLTQRWYEIFIKRLSLLIPPPERKTDAQPQVGDVVLFLFTDPNFKKLWIWKIGLVEEQLSRSTYKIRYSSPDGERRYVERAARQLSIIVPANQPPM